MRIDNCWIVDWYQFEYRGPIRAGSNQHFYWVHGGVRISADYKLSSSYLRIKNP